MNKNHLSRRNTLLTVSIAAALGLGLGLAGCDNTAEDRAADAPTRTAPADRTATTQTAGESAREAGDDAAQAMSDTWITTKVKSVLLADSEAKGFDVGVDTQDGVVTLEGELTSQAAIDHVKALAQDVEGVKRVNTNALTVARR